MGPSGPFNANTKFDPTKVFSLSNAIGIYQNNIYSPIHVPKFTYYFKKKKKTITGANKITLICNFLKKKILTAKCRLDLSS